MSNHIHVVSKTDAWEVASRIFPSDFVLDQDSPDKAGYEIFRSIDNKSEARICDLGCRLEVIIDNDTTNIWIDERKTNFETNDAIELLEIAKHHFTEKYKLLCDAAKNDFSVFAELSEIYHKIVKYNEIYENIWR